MKNKSCDYFKNYFELQPHFLETVSINTWSERTKNATLALHIILSYTMYSNSISLCYFIGIVLIYLQQAFTGKQNLTWKLFLFTSVLALFNHASVTFSYTK